MTNPAASAVERAIRATHRFFEANSGWGEPSRDAIEEWAHDRACQCPDECWVAPVGICEHGLASWWLVLRSMGEHVDLAPTIDASVGLRHAPNFRDLGGLVTVDGRSIAPGRLFRSGVFDQLDDIDRSHLRAIGLQVAIDLRSSDERAARVNAFPDGVDELVRPVTDVSAHPQTIADRIARGDTDGLGAEMLISGNRHFVEDQAPRFGEVVRTMLDPENHAVVVHCTAGKDRTGFAVACALWTLGVDGDTVTADYLRTNSIMHDHHERTLAEVASRGIDTTKLEEMLVVRAEYLDAAVDAARARYGSIDGFVRAGLGIGDAERDAARSRLLLP